MATRCRVLARGGQPYEHGEPQKATPRERAQEKAFGERTEGLGRLIPRTSLFHLILLCALFHFALSHLDRHDVNFVLGGILMCLERYLMPFMALQGLWVAHRPALVVLVDERFSVSANFAGEAHRFRRRLLGFHGFLLHFARLLSFLSKREQGHHERERERNQHQFFHIGTPFGGSTVTKRLVSSFITFRLRP